MRRASLGKARPAHFPPFRHPAKAARLRPSKGPGQFCGEAVYLTDGGPAGDFRFSVGLRISASRYWKIVVSLGVRAAPERFSRGPGERVLPRAETYVCLSGQVARAPRGAARCALDLPCAARDRWRHGGRNFIAQRITGVA